MSLPADLAAAEAELLTALESALASQSKGRWTLDLRFEGLRLAPVALAQRQGGEADDGRHGHDADPEGPVRRARHEDGTTHQDGRGNK